MYDVLSKDNVSKMNSAETGASMTTKRFEERADRAQILHFSQNLKL